VRSHLDSDVIVVGAGPAGAVAARTLAQAGARVRILERARFPRNKPCGGAISARVRHRFPWLSSSLIRIPTHEISKLYLEGPGGDVLRLESDGPAVLMIRRIEFDQLLCELACEAGADLIEGAAVGQVSVDGHVALRDRAGREYRAPIVIAADGVNSVVARRLGLNAGWPAHDLALDMMEETPKATLASADPSVLWVYYGYGRSHGYAYVFPKQDHVNVGIGYVLSYFRARVNDAPYDLQQRFVADLRTRAMLDGRSARENFTPFLIPVGGPLGQTGRGRVLLAGDAGGFVNGFTAEGIYYAMVTGELAARAVLETGSAVEGLARRYARSWQKEIGTELRDSVLVQRFLFADERRIRTVIEGARARPDLANAIVDYARGRLPYRAARWRLLRSVPLAGLELAWHAAAGRRRVPQV
jgi:geranylgeranyl reductase family protein